MVEKNDKVIAVLGAGAVGKSLAADCALAGSRVRLCDLPPYSEKSLANIDRTGIRFYGMELNLYGFRRNGVAHFEKVTDSVAEAMDGADIVIVALPCVGHKKFFAEMIPQLKDGMAVHIFPDNYGSLILRKMMREAGCDKKVVVGGWSSSPYGTRVDTVGGVAMPAVDVEYRAISLRGAAMPLCDQEAFIESAKYIAALDSVFTGDGPAYGDTVLDIGFSNVNPILHVPGVVCGVGAMENYGLMYGNHKEDFSIYSHVYCPSVSKVQYKVYEEELSLAKALGVGMQEYEWEEFLSRESILGQEYMGKGFAIPFEDINHIAWGTGPTSVYSRYITEDVPVGCKIFHEFGKLTGTPTPIIDSLISISSVLVDKNYFEEGYTLEEIGLGGMTVKEINAYVRGE